MRKMDLPIGAGMHQDLIVNIPKPAVSRVYIPEPEGLVSAIRGSQLEPWLLSGQRKASCATRIVLANACLDQVEIGPAMWFRGVMPKDSYTMVYVHASQREGHSFNFSKNHYGQCLGFYPPGETTDSKTPEGYRNATLTMPVRVFDSMLENEYRDLPSSLRKRGMPFFPSVDACHALHSLLAMVMETTHVEPGAFEGREAQHSLECALHECFFRLMLDERSDKPAVVGLPIAKRYRCLALVREFICEHQHRPIQLRELCELSGLSRRGLEYLFRDLLGVRLAEMLRRLRMQGVRRELLAADPDRAWVKRIALDWGFWHLGRFAVEYRTLYGESPSETLVRQGARGECLEV